MTDRQKFVMTAMQGLLHSYHSPMNATPDLLAQKAVQIADATMKAELDSRPKVPLEVQGEQDPST